MAVGIAQIRNPTVRRTVLIVAVVPLLILGPVFIAVITWAENFVDVIKTIPTAWRGNF